MTMKIAEHPLKEEAERALYDLSLSFELQEGKRFKWRKNSQQLFMMVHEGFNSQYSELVHKAIHFFTILPYEIQHEFMARRILPPTEEQLKKRLYRGVEMDESQAEEKTQSTSTLHYRGVAIDRSGNSIQKEPVTNESHTTEKKKVKRVWRGVVTYVDE